MADEQSLQRRTLELHGTLQLEPGALEARLKKIEEKLEGKGDKGVLAWLLEVLKTLLPSVVLALLGFALKDTVDQALREREIQLEAVKEMEKLAPGLRQHKLDIVREDAEYEAEQLAAFGRYSVPFFVNLLELGNQNAKVGAQEGLRIVARSEPEPVCASLQTVIRNRTGLYTWQTHWAALRVLGQAGCTRACPEVARFRHSMLSVENYSLWVSNDPMKAEYDKVDKQASDTFDQLKRVEPGQCN